MNGKLVEKCLFGLDAGFYGDHLRQIFGSAGPVSSCQRVLSFARSYLVNQFARLMKTIAER